MPIKKTNGRIANRYDHLHSEIFNPIEQERLGKALSTAIKAVRTNSSARGGLTALDYGSGSGNLTRHLIEAGIETVSADISDVFLALIEQEFSQTGLSKPLKSNGEDYLLYKSPYKLNIYNQYKNNCADQWVPAARKGELLFLL